MTFPLIIIFSKLISMQLYSLQFFSGIDSEVLEAS